MHHIPIPDTSFFSFFTQSGSLAVSFFFVLSGFLITYLLLFEKLQRGSISFRRFFSRRVLRIWPLFYAMLLFAFLTPFILKVLNLESSNEGYEPNWIVSMLFLENYQMMLTNSFPNTAPMRVMWSLCVEEHFYIVWGIIIYLISLNRIFLLFLSCIVLSVVVRIIYNLLGLPFLDLFSNLDSFALGAIPAYLLLFKRGIIARVEEMPVSAKYIIVGTALLLTFAIPNLNRTGSSLLPLLYNSLYALVILITLPVRNHFRIRDKNIVSRLGTYTYGLYMFHTIFIMLFIRIIDDFDLNIKYWIIAISSLVVTIAVSLISYHLYEKPFLKLKTKLK